MVHFCQINLVQ